MTTHKRKKNTRLRGSKTHGYGSKKKHRGHGHRGGSGLGGTGKKGDAKKPSFWKDVDYFGKNGFTSKSRVKTNAVTLQYLDENAEKIGKENKGIYEINGKGLGFNKILGTGKATKKMNIICDSATKSAIEKIQQAGGSVTLTKKSEPKKEEPSEKQ